MDAPAIYEDDVYAWAHEQAALLRRLGRGKPGLPNALDLENIAEEIEGVARTELHRAESFLRLVLLHLIKIASAPQASAVEHWRAEVDQFHLDLLRSLSSSLKPKIELDKRWRLAIRQAQARLAQDGDRVVGGLPDSCPLSLDDLAEEPFDIDRAVERLIRSATAVEPLGPQA